MNVHPKDLKLFMSWAALTVLVIFKLIEIQDQRRMLDNHYH